MFRTAAMHQHHLSVNGGSKAVHYMISTQYFQQDGILRETTTNVSISVLIWMRSWVCKIRIESFREAARTLMSLRPVLAKV